MGLLTQSFCNGCGFSLSAALEERLQKMESLLARARDFAQEGKYKEAIRLLKGICSPPDYRFKKIAEQGKQLVDTFQKDENHWLEEIERTRLRLERYFKQDRHTDIVRILSRIPYGMLDQELASALESSQVKVQIINSSKQELKKAIQEKEYINALECLIQLVELEPANKTFQEQLQAIVGKVIARGEKYLKANRFEKAQEYLQSVPANFQSAAYLKMLSQCEEVLSLKNVVETASQLNPLVSNCIERLKPFIAEEKLNAFRALERKELSNVSKAPFRIWPAWQVNNESKLGIPLHSTKLPPELIGEKSAQVHAATIFVAYGLAIHAAKRPFPNADLLRKGKKSLLGFLGSTRSSAAAAWGIDVGDSSIKAVHIIYGTDDSPPIIDRCVVVPIAREANQRKLDKEALDHAVAKLLGSISVENSPVCINYPGNEIIARYMLLPPNGDRKKFDDFVMQDAKAHMPIALDLLKTSYHISDAGGENSAPSAIFIAARKQEVEFRQALLKDAGLPVDSFLPEPYAIALALQTWKQFSPEHFTAPTKEGEEERDRLNSAQLVLDVGQRRTNIIVSHTGGIWHRALDWGLDNLTKNVASQFDLAAVAADAMRRDPITAPNLAQALDAMRNATAIPNREIERSILAANSAIGNLTVSRAFLIGGGAHQPFLESWLQGLPL